MIPFTSCVGLIAVIILVELLQISLEIKKILYAAEAKDSVIAEAEGEFVNVGVNEDDNTTEY